MDFAELISGLIVIGAGGLTTVVMGLFRKASTWVDGLPKRAKQAIVLGIAFGVVQLNGLLGLTMPVDALGWTADLVNTLIAAGLSFGAYNVFKPKVS